MVVKISGSSARICGTVRLRRAAYTERVQAIATCHAWICVTPLQIAQYSFLYSIPSSVLVTGGRGRFGETQLASIVLVPSVASVSAGQESGQLVTIWKASLLPLTRTPGTANVEVHSTVTPCSRGARSEGGQVEGGEREEGPQQSLYLPQSLSHAHMKRVSIHVLPHVELIHNSTAVQ